MSNQRSILSFFSSSAAGSVPPKPLLPKPAPSQPPSQPLPRQRQAPLPPPPPPPPPSSSSLRPLSAVVRTGGSPAPSLTLPPIDPARGRALLVAGGAVEAGDDVVFETGSSGGRAPDVTMVFPRPAHVPDLVSVNGILLPVRYPDSFYQLVADATRTASLFNRVLVADGGRGRVVGGVVCRLEPSPFAGAAASADAPLAVYIQSLALLSPHRGRGLAAAALDSILATVRALNVQRSAAAAAAESGAAALLPGPITAIYAHVWTENDEALQWYMARGFVRHGAQPVASYYFALRPDTAWIVRRDVQDGANVPAAVSAAAAPPPAATEAAPATSAPPTAQSYQNARPQTEWNDLPADMVTGASAASSAVASAASSRAASRAASRTVSVTGIAAQPSLDDGALPPPPQQQQQQPSSSRSSSSGTSRKKRERAYPAAMFQ